MASDLFTVYNLQPINKIHTALGLLVAGVVTSVMGGNLVGGGSGVTSPGTAGVTFW